MGDELKRYNAVIGNKRGAVATVLVLDEAGAKARGLSDADLVDAPKKAKAAGTPQNKAAAPSANKSRRPAAAKKAAAPKKPAEPKKPAAIPSASAPVPAPADK